MTKKLKAPLAGEFLADESLPIEQRREMLKMTILESHPGANEFLDDILKRLKSRHAKSVYEKKCEKLSALIKDLESGPLRTGVFISLDESPGSRHAQVRLDDGTNAFSVVADEEIAASLKKGDQVLLDGRGTVVLRNAPNMLKTGDEATFERTVNHGCIEVCMNGQERSVFFPSADLEERIQSGEVTPGDTLVVNLRQSIAFDALPPSDSHTHFKYLVKEAVPDVIAERDIGSPPDVIEKLANHVRIEMTRPEIRRRFGLRRSSMNLLTGIPGTGKTLSVEAIWRQTYEIMSEVTGAPIDLLPPRVFKLKMSSLLSQWLGQSDKNIERFFDEIQQLESELWTAPDGKEYQLPVIAILEEIDGVARTRGQGSDGIYDRLLTGVLQRLDPSSSGLKSSHVLFLGTTNEPEQVDSAFLRRIGANVEKFGRLDRSGFVKVLKKQIASRPIEHPEAEEGHAAVVSDLTAWLFSRNGSDPGVIELTYAGDTAADVRCRRDFLTGALIDRAVQQAAEKAANEAWAGQNGSGIHLEHFVEAIDGQIRTTADQINEQNAHKYLEIPDAARVATVRRLPQPSQFPLQLQSH